jgi:hypothetical protein
MSGRAGGAKRRAIGIDEYVGPSMLPDSMPPLGTDSQEPVIVIDSQGGTTLEPGPGAQRDALLKAEKAALVADAQTNVAAALAALKEADDAVRSAQALQAARARKLNETRQMLYDLTGGY